MNYVPGVFEVTKVIVLGKEDFEKLSEDVSPEYPFLKDNRELMSADPGGLFRCLMVRTKGEQEYMLIAQGRNSLYLGYGKDCRKVNLQDVPMEHLVLEEPKAYQEHAVFYHRPHDLKGLIAAIAAGGWVAVVIILLICLIALIVGSCFGLFFGSDSTGTGTSVTQAVTTLNGEFQAHIQEIEDSNSHNRVEFTSNDGVLSINWEDVLAVFSAKVTGAEDGTQVASLDDTQVQQMRDIMWEMNAVSSSTRTESHEVEVTEVDEDGKETTRTETVTETILEISLTHKTAEEMAQQYNFNARQNEYLALMSEPENQNLWAELLGGFNSGGGQIMNPNTDWEGTGIFQWPLPQSYTITSWFGYREDPFTGEIAYHSGTDIGAPGGTPILTAADGTVTIANAIDTWGGGYGYYIKINHNDTFDTLYAHCSSICVTVGQEVKQGEVIGYVGTTGNSTGNHLHFEVWQNGERTDALGYFKAKE